LEADSYISKTYDISIKEHTTMTDSDDLKEKIEDFAGESHYQSIYYNSY
jgi:hypothetical protein